MDNFAFKSGIHGTTAPQILTAFKNICTGTSHLHQDATDLFHPVMENSCAEVLVAKATLNKGKYHYSLSNIYSHESFSRNVFISCKIFPLSIMNDPHLGSQLYTIIINERKYTNAGDTLCA